MITVPLRRWRGEPIGVLNVLNKRAGPFTNHDLGLLTIISAFAALAIQQAKQFEDAKKAEMVTLLGDIGHDMKNLLTPVQAGVELLREEVNELFGGMSTAQLSEKKADKDICDEAGDMAQNGIRRLHDRVKEMADCVKGLSAPPDFTLCSVGPVVLEVFHTLQGLARDKQITLRTEGLESLPEFHADERRLYNAFYNLINNAIPETPPGGSITVRGHLDQDTGEHCARCGRHRARDASRNSRPPLFSQGDQHQEGRHWAGNKNREGRGGRAQREDLGGKRAWCGHDIPSPISPRPHDRAYLIRVIHSRDMRGPKAEGRDSKI